MMETTNFGTSLLACFVTTYVEPFPEAHYKWGSTFSRLTKGRNLNVFDLRGSEFQAILHNKC
jgi:hypothetical protein